MRVKKFKEHGGDIAITLPATVRWDDYQRELDAAANGAVMNFKVRYLPSVDVGCKCYLVHQGVVRGWMRVSGLSRDRKFTCTTTGREWSGNFVERTGEFHTVDPVPMKGFRGYRYVTGDPVSWSEK